jgi:hypothetical protein
MEMFSFSFSSLVNCVLFSSLETACLLFNFDFANLILLLTTVSFYFLNVNMTGQDILRASDTNPYDFVCGSAL